MPVLAFNVVKHCQARNVKVTGFMPLAVGKVMKDPTLAAVAEAHNASIAQVVLAWELQQNIATIPSSSNPANLASNLKATTLTLSDNEMAKIATLERGERIANPDFAPDWDI